MIDRATNIPKLERIDLSFLDGARDRRLPGGTFSTSPYADAKNDDDARASRGGGRKNHRRDTRSTAHGISPQSLDKIKTLVTELASQPELFPWEHFPLGDGSAPRIYRLSEDSDGRFAMYASVGGPGKSQPPHKAV
jgi:hypothetical protein